MKVIGHISCGIDALDIGLAVLVDHDAVVDLHSRIEHEIGDWLYPYAGHNVIALDATTSTCQHALHMSCALEGSYRFLKKHMHPVVTMEFREDAPDLLAQHPIQRRFERLNYRDLYAKMAERRRNLGADEPHADQHRVATTEAPFP